MLTQDRMRQPRLECTFERNTFKGKDVLMPARVGIRKVSDRVMGEGFDVSVFPEDP